MPTASDSDTVVLKEDLLGMKVTPRSDGSFFCGPDWVVMSFEYIDNQVSKAKLAEIDQEAKDSPKAHGLKFFYKRNH